MGVSPYRPLIPHDWLGLEKIIKDLWNIINVDTTLSEILTPPGSDTEIIYNDAGAYGSDSTFTFNDGTKKLTCQVLDITTVAASVVDTDKFLVDDSNEVKFRTGAELLSDIGASASGHLHDGDTLEMDGVNSDGGAFSFSTTGGVTFNQAITAPNAILSGTVAIGLDMSGGTFATAVQKWPGGTLLHTDDLNIQATVANKAVTLSDSSGDVYLYADEDIFYIVDTTPVVIVAGNPYGLLLLFTYPATP